MDDVVLTAHAAKNLLDYGQHHAVKYLAPLRDAITSKAVAGHLIFRDTVGAQMDLDRPNIAICFDVLDGGTGPEGFDARLIDDFVKAAAAVVVVARFDDPQPYADAVAVALKSGGLVLLAETTEAAAGAWLALSNGGRNARWLLWSAAPAGRA